MIKAGYTRLREDLGLLVPPLGMDLALGTEYQDQVSDVNYLVRFATTMMAG